MEIFDGYRPVAFIPVNLEWFFQSSEEYIDYDISEMEGELPVIYIREEPNGYSSSVYTVTPLKIRGLPEGFTFFYSPHYYFLLNEEEEILYVRRASW